MRLIIISIMFMLPYLSYSQNNKANIEKLCDKVFTESHVRSPYLPALFDQAYKSDELKSFNELLFELNEQAQKRRLVLESNWQSLKSDKSAKYLLLQYIFEEKPQSFLDKHFKNFPDEIKYEAARLLISECEFKKGLGILLDLHKALKENSPLKKKVSNFLKNYSSYEKDLDRAHSLLFHDLSKFQFERKKTEEAFLERPLEPEDYNRGFAHSDERNYDFPDRINYNLKENATPIFLFQGKYGAYLSEKKAGSFWLPGENQEITLHTLFKGEVVYQLFKIEDHEIFKSISPEKFKKLKPIKVWNDRSTSSKGNHSSDYAKIKVKLPELNEGKYLLTAKPKFCPFLLVKRIAVTEKILFSNKNISSVDIIVLNRKTLKPIIGESIRVKDSEENTSLVKKSDKNGLISIDDIFESNKLYIESVSAPILLRTYITTKNSQLSDIAAVWTAAPMYKPGELVQFRGNIRKKSLEHSVPTDRNAVSVLIRDRDNKSVWSQTLALSQQGSFHGEFKLALASKVGEYSFHINNQEIDGFKVKAYRLPRFKFALQNNSTFHEIGSNYKNTITLQHMNGAPMSRQNILVSLSDGKLKAKEYKHKTDGNGQIHIDIDHNQLSKNSVNTINFEFRSPDGHINKEKHEISYFENPLLLSLNTEHFPNESIYSPSLYFNIRDYVKPTSISYKLLDAEGKLIKSIESSQGEIVVKKSQGVKSIECTVTYQGYTTTIKKEHIPESKINNKLLSIRSKKTAKDQEIVNLNIAWNPKSAKSTKAYLFGQNLKTSFRKVLNLKVGNNSIPVKMERKWGPNVYFNLYVFSPESRNQYLESSCSVKIDSNEELKLSIVSDKKVYKPGQDCSVTIACTDKAGNPLSGSEISLSVLNESLFANSTAKPIASIFNQYSVPDMHRLAYGGRHNYHYTKKWHLGAALSISFDHNYRTYGISRFGASHSGIAVSYYGGLSLKKKPRIKFNEIAVWKPLLVTDEEGKVTVNFKMPDTVTNWIFDVKAISTRGVAGEAIAEAATDLKIETDFIMPRIVRSGDRVGMPIQIINRSEKTHALLNAQVKHNGKFLRSVREKSIQLPANTVVGKFLYTKIPSKGTLEYKTSIHANEENDYAVRNLKITPTGYLNSDYHYIGKKAVESFDLPSDGIFPHTIEVNAQLETSLQEKVLNAMKRLKGYKYGCAEQTISRFTPLIVVNDSLKKIGAVNPFEKEMPAIIDAGLARLYRFQHADGGWLWYEYGKSSYRISTLVLEGLIEAHAQGILVDHNAIHRGAEFVSAQFNNNVQASDNDSVIGVGDRTSYLASTVLSRYAYLFNKEEITKELKQKVKSLKESIKQKQEALYLCKTLVHLKEKEEALKLFNKTISEKLSYENRADVILAGAKLELAKILTPKQKYDYDIHQLTGMRKNGWWYDTRATHIAIRGLAKHLGSDTDRYAIEVYLNSKHIGQLNSKNLKLHLKGSQLKGAKLSFKNHTGNKYNAFVSIKAYGSKKLPFKNPQASIISTFREQVSQAPLSSKKALTLNRKKYYTYEIHFNSKVDLKYSRLSIPRPAGIEILSKPKLRAGIVSFEEYDDSFDFFIENLKAGTYTLTMNFRADLPGEVFAPLPELDSMYGQKLKVNSYAPEKWIIR